MHRLAALVPIIIGVMICRAFDPTWDITGFWPVLVEIVGAGTGLALIGAGLAGMFAAI